MKHFSLAIAAAVCTSTAPAMADTTELMFCALENSSKMVTVTLDKADVIYEFGNLNAKPDLMLSTPVADIDYEPWPGVSNTIWETITFYNGDYGYKVIMGIERVNDLEKYGGIYVTNNGKEIAQLDCIPSSVSFEFDNSLSDAKAAAGLCVNRDETTTWSPCE